MTVLGSWLSSKYVYTVSMYAGQSPAEYDAQRAKMTAKAAGGELLAGETVGADQQAEIKVQDFLMYLVCLRLFIKGIQSLVS